MKWLLVFSALATVALVLVDAQSSASRWNEDIEAFEAQDAAGFPPAHACLFVGSSSIRRWKTLANDFPDELVLNRGFGGSQLSDVNAFVHRIVIPYRPRMIVLYCGDNDIVAGKSPEIVLTEFKRFVATVRSQLPATRIAFLSMKPAPATWRDHWEAMREGNGLIGDYVDENSHLVFIDLATPMLGADGKPRVELFVEDGEHLNAAGYALRTSIVKPYLRSSEALAGSRRCEPVSTGSGGRPVHHNVAIPRSRNDRGFERSSYKRSIGGSIAETLTVSRQHPTFHRSPTEMSFPYAF